MDAQIESVSDLDDVRALLIECGLPVSDISPTPLPHFFGIRAGAALVAVVGLDLFGQVALLRSLAVLPAHRGRGLARRLVAHAETVAAAAGVEALFLLTTSASGLFAKLGYVPAARPDAPPAIQGTRQFTDLCPASSALLAKRLAGRT